MRHRSGCLPDNEKLLSAGNDETLVDSRDDADLQAIVAEQKFKAEQDAAARQALHGAEEIHKAQEKTNAEKSAVSLPCEQKCMETTNEPSA